MRAREKGKAQAKQQFTQGEMATIATAGVDPRRVPTTEEEITNHPMVKDCARLWDKLENARPHNEWEKVNVPLTDFDIRQLQFGLEENRKRTIKALTDLTGDNNA